MHYKKLIILIMLLVPSWAFALQGSFILDSMEINSTTINLHSGEIDFYSNDLGLFETLIYAYQSGSETLLDYETDGEINYIGLNNALYPVVDISKIASFLIGGIAALALVIGISIKF